MYRIYAAKQEMGPPGDGDLFGYPPRAGWSRSGLKPLIAQEPTSLA